MRVLGIDPGYAIVGWGVVDYVSPAERHTSEVSLVTTDRTTVNLTFLLPDTYIQNTDR